MTEEKRDERLEKVGRRLGNIADLPDDLKKQLQATKMNELEMQIVEVINDFEGMANIDEVLVGLYRKFKLIQERPFISNRMYRMSKNGLLKSVKGKKGVYQTT